MDTTKDKKWLLFINEMGVHQLVCEKTDKRYYFRMKIFLRNFFKGRYCESVKIDEPVKKNSLLYQIARRGNRELKKEDKLSVLDESECRAAVDGYSVILSWDELEGTSICVDQKEGNVIIAELRMALCNNNEWWTE